MRKPPNESDRLARLRALNVLDSGLNESLQAVTNLAKQISGCSYAFISFVEEDKQLLRAVTGFSIPEIPRSLAICSEAILSAEPLIIGDLQSDDRFFRSPLCAQPINGRFYAAFPLLVLDHFILGTLCIFDTSPNREMQPAVITALTQLAKHVVGQLELNSKLSSVQRAISSLEDSEQRFRRIADASPVLLWISDQAGNRTLSNKAWCDFTGLSHEESLAECWRDSVHPSDRAVYQAKWLEVARSHNKFQHEYRLRHVSQTYRWVLEQAIPLFSSSGRLEAYVSSCVDLSLRSSDELQYQHNEARFRAISEAAPLGIVVTDSNGSCIYSNHNFQKISGLSIDECLGSGWLRQIHPEDFQEISNAWIHANQTAKSFEHTLRYLRPDGSISWCSFKAAAINATDTVSGWVTTVDDITARRRAEDELIAAKQSAESAMHAKSQFLANISHEIRTPLTAIIGFADALREDNSLAPTHRHCIDVILNNGNHLLNIINQILDLAKIDAGALSVERTECSLVELLEELRVMFSSIAAEKSLKFNVEYQWPLPRTVTTDPLRLKQILINLIGNAIKFTPAGTVSVKVSWNAQSRIVNCRISDTGIGLTAEQLERLFQPFYQANESTTRTFGGTGLGLSISQRLIKALGGSIEVASEAGKGTTFNFSIQCYDSINQPELQQDVDDRNSRRSLSSTTEVPSICGSILFADDALDNRRLIEHLLRKTGADITLVENGLEATKVALSRPFNLILMDIQMPFLDGLSATRQIRAAGITTPVIAVSAGAMTSDIERALAAGCTQHLSKPFDKRAFYEIISRYLEPTTPGATTPPPDAPICSTICEDDDELQLLINEFIGGLSARYSSIEDAASQADWSTLAACAHRLKGSAGMYGFPELAACAASIEQAAKSRSGNHARTQCQELKRLIARVTC